MQRLTISIDDELGEELDRLMKKRGYSNRSEIFRDLLRKEIAQTTALEGVGNCVAIVSYMFDHQVRQLSSRMVEHHHNHSESIISTMHVHINQELCAEAVVMKGPIREVQALADDTISQTGIINGHVHCIPVDITPEHEPHDHHHEHDHGHHQSHENESHQHHH